jgi:hypothetical protein
MVWWALLTGLFFGILTGEAWIWWRDRETPPRHANEPSEGTVFDWLRREPVDLDKRDDAHRGKKAGP